MFQTVVSNLPALLSESFPEASLNPKLNNVVQTETATTINRDTERSLIFQLTIFFQSIFKLLLYLAFKFTSNSPISLISCLDIDRSKMDLAELHGNSDQASLYDGDEVKLSEKVGAFCIVTRSLTAD